MSNIYRKLNIEQNVELKLNISKEKFSKDFIANVSPDKHFFVLDILDNSRFKYYGNLDSNSIFIRKKITLLELDKYLIATGDFFEFDNKTCLNLRIRSFYPIQAFILILGILFMIYLLYLAFTTENGLSLLILIIPFFIIFFTYPIYKARKNLKTLKHQLETDLKLFTYD